MESIKPGDSVLIRCKVKEVILDESGTVYRVRLDDNSPVNSFISEILIRPSNIVE